MHARVDHRPRILLPLALLILMALPASPAAAQQQTTQPREHVVRRGDTLWGLARTYLMNPFLWPRIFDANRSVVEDPHWIYPDERLMIPGLTDTLAVPISVVEQAPAAPVEQGQGRSRFFDPQAPVGTPAAAPTQLSFAQEEDISVSRAEQAAAPWLADTSSLGIVGRVTALSDPRRRSDLLAQRVHPHDRLYVGRLRGGSPANGDSLLVVDIRQAVRGFGHKIVPVALVRVEEQADGAVVAVVLHQHGEARTGDVVILAPPRPQAVSGRPADIANGPTGEIVAFLDEDPLKGVVDQGFIDLGADQVRLGDILVASLPPEVAGGEGLRVGRVARLKVVRTDERSSTVRVLDMYNTALTSGLPVRVTQRQP